MRFLQLLAAYLGKINELEKKWMWQGFKYFSKRLINMAVIWCMNYILYWLEELQRNV